MLRTLARRARATVERWRQPANLSVLPLANSLRDAQLNVDNFGAMRAEPPDSFAIIRFDPNNTCNIHCVYCHNVRSDGIVTADELHAFIHQNVIAVNVFQFGCGMEPTMDMRLADLMTMVGESPARPRVGMTLQTNGILLNRHNAAQMRDAGLTELSVSVDAADPTTQKSLRGGMKLERLLRNVDAFRQAAPGVKLTFIATVTSENVDHMPALIRAGRDAGANAFILREMFYQRDNNIVDHSRMPALVLPPGRFAEMELAVRSAFGDTEITFAPVESIEEATVKMVRDSRY